MSCLEMDAVDFVRDLSRSWLSLILTSILAFWLYRYGRAQVMPTRTSSSPAGGSTKLTAGKSCSKRKHGFGLVQVCQPKVGVAASEPGVDIIAIHGLDTKSPDTWIWKDPEDPTDQSRWVNWLKDLLPERVGNARIFTYEWLSDLFERQDLRQKSIEEFAQRLLEAIKSRPAPQRPILFIASCVGGIVLMQALVIAGASGDEQVSRYRVVTEQTRGIIFLATPFRGTAFEDIATWAEPALATLAHRRGKTVSKLLDNLKGPTMPLQRLVNKFSLLCLDPHHRYHLFTFYETGKTDILRERLRWLRVLRGKLKPVSLAEIF